VRGSEPAPSGRWCVYMLKCFYARGGERRFNLYTGSTNDVAARLKRHKEGSGAKYTRRYGGDLELAYVEECAGRSEALRREAEIKSLSREKKEALVGRGLR
jgi:putative endonuclease